MADRRSYIISKKKAFFWWFLSILDIRLQSGSRKIPGDMKTHWGFLIYAFAETSREFDHSHNLSLEITICMPQFAN